MRANQQLIIKNNMLLTAQNSILIAKCFTRQYCFPIQNFAYNTQETYLSIYPQFLCYYCNVLQ